MRLNNPGLAVADLSGVDFGATAEADFNAAVDLALNTIIPASPTAGSLNALIRSIRGAIGKVYYCDWDSGSDTANNGLSWSSPFKSITKALTVAVAYDTIFVKQGIYLEGATLNITQNGLKIIGVMTSELQFGQPSIHTHGTEALMTINAHEVEIAFLGFHDQGAGTSIQIGNIAVAWRTHIHDCFFGGNDTALYGIDTGPEALSYDAPFTVIERCYFQHYATAAIHLNSFNSTVRDCIFQIGTAKVGIQYHPNGGDRPYGYILNNLFTTSDSTDGVGITVEGTPTAGYLSIDGNRFVNFADSTTHCVSKRTGYMGLNYSGITACAVT